ncbi:MAG: lysine exporter LysO family protein [Rikenellaceae bacterium]
MKGSIIIVSFFILGLMLARFDLLSEAFYNESYSSYVLYVMIICVGMSIGGDIKLLDATKKYGYRIFLPPVATIVGTLGGALILGICWSGRSVVDCLTVSSGFGYYSISSIITTELRGEELGVVSLISNVCREVFTLLFTPLLVVAFGKVAPICSGGATTIGTTLPIITTFSGKEFAIVAIFHGFVIDLLMPFIVSLFASM